MKTLVLFSGGLDSAVLLASLLPDAVALTFDYGQPHRLEIKYAQEFCNVRDVEHLVVPLQLAGGGLLDKDSDTPVVPGRNFAMLAVAATYAIRTGSVQIAIGVAGDDRDLFADCRPMFIQAFNRMNVAPPVIAPLIDKMKWEIMSEGLDLGVDPRDTWSCYAPGEDNSPCGRCVPCRLRHQATCDVLRECPRPGP
jgi:7-cyano-7-deazaguanine synthase